MTQATELPVGSIVAFSSGEYSDYSVGAFSRVLKPINETVWKAMIEACTVVPDYDKKAEPRFDEYRSVPWLTSNGYIEDIPYTELHLGEYRQCPPWSEA